MTNEQRIRNLSVPESRVDVVLDTDAYNEIDDQFAIAYLLKSKEKLNTKAIYAAPFLNSNSVSPKNGMEKSYNEILKLISLLGEKVDVFKGSERFLDNENTPVISSAAQNLAERVKKYSPQKPLYVVAIGAITNIASAILLNPEFAENTIKTAECYAKGSAWTRVIWDVTAVAWLLNDSEKFMESRIIPTPIPTYDNFYATDYNGYPMRYVYNIKRDNLMTDLFRKLTE